MSSVRLLEGFSGKLADRWSTALFTQAFVFWLGGGLAALQRFGWDVFVDFYKKLPEPLPIGVALLALLVITASGFIVQQFEFTTLQLLEGYWPSWCRSLQKYLIRRQRQRFNQIDQQYQMFNRQGLTKLTSEEHQAYIQVDLKLSEFPDRERILPTKLGNILRAAEDRCTGKYGLDAIICWPRLWLLLPDSAKSELSEARNSLNLIIRLWLWSFLFILWSPVLWVWWPFPIGLVATWLAHRWMLQAAMIYGDLLESAFDLYRFQLYEALHWPLPTNPKEERELGRMLTDYLWHGSEQSFPKFSLPK